MPLHNEQDKNGGENRSQVAGDELFDACLDMATGAVGPSVCNRRMHEVLVLACSEGTRRSGMSFGSLFAQVDYLCKRCGMSAADKVAVQVMRRHSNSDEPLGHTDLLYDLRALCLFISAVFAVDVPGRLLGVLPPHNRPVEQTALTNVARLRCIVDDWDDTFIYVTSDDDRGGRQLEVDCSDRGDGLDYAYLWRLLAKGMQLNLLDCHADGNRIRPGLVVVEPDFLVDISSVAACFTDYGHSPLAYTINRMRPRANSQAILLGNFAGSALDNIINNESFNLNETIANSFKSQAMQFCTCPQFSAQEFIAAAKAQADNLQEVVQLLFSDPKVGRLEGYDRSKAMLEPSFVCESLGLQGRADLITTDMKLLVEQKSGRMPSLDFGCSTSKMRYQESHYVQLLLYYGVLRYNYGVTDNTVDMRLLYSKYKAADGLLVVNFYRSLFREAIKLRNRIVAGEFAMGNGSFAAVMNHLGADAINEKGLRDRLFEGYIRPQTEAVTAPLHRLSAVERAYFVRMTTFVYREQLAHKVGSQEGVSGSVADLWNMPLEEKLDTGNIYTGLHITDKRCSTGYSGFDLFTLAVPQYDADFLPNFRRGDIIYMYAYNGTPDVRRSVLHRGVLCEISTDSITVRLSNGQRNPSLFGSGTYAVEHGGADSAASALLRSLHSFITSPKSIRDLLLGQRAPEADTSLRLTRSYHPSYDEVLLSAKQSRDYYLLQGPPGTGKTSMALRFLVEEELADSTSSILLTAYTNRAVDEICAMLDDAGIGFLRIGNESSCDPRFAGHLLEAALGSTPKLEAIRSRIVGERVVVGTTSTLLARPFVFALKKFSLTIVDEASQILEPGIVGLLTGRFILIGDHKQLPAVVAQSETESAVDDAALRSVGLEDCRQSLFERLLRWERLCGRTRFAGILRRQGRMHPDIAAFPNEMFYRNERLEPVPCDHQTETSLSYDAAPQDMLDRILQQRRMIFLPVDAPAPGDDGGGLKSNVAEARIVADVLRRIVRFYGDRFNPQTTVGVIVPYRNQIAMIRKEMARLGLDGLDGVSIDTVERYQGSQRDVIIYSFTVTKPFQLAFLTSNTFMEDGRPIDRKLNVALTRARRQMIMTGCPRVLQANPLFAELMRRYGVRSGSIE